MNDIQDKQLYNGARRFSFQSVSTYYSMCNILQSKNILVLSLSCNNLYDFNLLSKAFNQKYLPKTINTIIIYINGLESILRYSDISLDQVKLFFESISITSPSHYKYLKRLNLHYDIDHLRRNFFELYNSNSFSIANYIIPTPTPTPTPTTTTNFLANIEILHIPLHFSDVRKFFDFLKKGGMKNLKILKSSDSCFYSNFNVLHTHIYKQHFVDLFKVRNISIPFPEKSIIELYDNQLCRTFFRELLDINRTNIGLDIFKKIDVCIQSEEFLSLFISLAEKKYFSNCIHIDLDLWFLTGTDDCDNQYQLQQLQLFTRVFNHTYFPKLESISFDYSDYINTLHSKDLWIMFFQKYVSGEKAHPRNNLPKTLRITNYAYHILLCLLESGVSSTVFQSVKHLEIGKFFVL
jgi:hypothetical protein